MVQKYSSVYSFLLITVFVTNLSQLPVLLDNSAIKRIVFIFWGVLAALSTGGYNHRNKSHVLSRIYVYSLLYYISCGVLFLLGKNGNTSFTYPLGLCLFVMFVSANVSSYLDETSIQGIAESYAISTIIVAISVLIIMIQRGFSWDSRIYFYNSKNSVSQILLTGAILFIYLREINGSKYIKKIFYDFCILLIVGTLLMLKSRATLLGVIIISIFVLRSNHFSKTTKTLFKLGSILFLLVLLISTSFRTSFVNNIVYAGRTGNLDNISSGRVSMILDFPRLFFRAPIFGNGRYYIEIMQLNTFVESGVFGGLFLNIIALLPVISAVSDYKRYPSLISLVFVMVSVCYYTNGFFEQLAPFGPGVKCYFLWMFLGLSIIWRNLRESNMDYKYADYI